MYFLCIFTPIKGRDRESFFFYSNQQIVRSSTPLYLFIVKKKPDRRISGYFMLSSRIHKGC